LTLIQYDLIENKHIPEKYLYNDVETRLELLAGIIDTDAYIVDGVVYITQTNFMDQVRFLVKSLGFHTGVVESDDLWGKKQKYLTMTGNLKIIPTTLHYKKCMKVSRESHLSVVSVKPKGIGRYCGFTVDGNSRFLLGDFTITHNSGGKAKHSNGRPIKGIKERLSGKGGLIRKHLMGKRRNQSARSAISADPTVRTNEIVVPDKIAENITMTDHVAAFNIEKLQELVDEGKVNYVIKKDGTKINLKYAMWKRGTQLLWGDKIIRNERELDPFNTEKKVVLVAGDKILRNGEMITDIQLMTKKVFKLEVGDQIERHLQNGDQVLFNRQPTLHRGSMLAKKVVRRPGKTLRFNLASTKSFNADYDGRIFEPSTGGIKSLQPSSI
jgi:hypothetical protein